MRRVVVAFLLVLWLTPAGLAAEPADVSLADEVAGHSGVTYLALVKQLFPEASAGGGLSGEPRLELRHIDDPAYEWRTPDPFELSRIQAVPFRTGGEDRTVLLVDVGWSISSPGRLMILTLFDNAPTPHLLDALDVSLDQHTSFGNPALLDLSADDQAMAIVNSHGNSNHGYLYTSLLFAREDRLELIDNIFTFSEHSCAFENRQTLSVEAMPNSDPLYAQLRASVLEEGSVIAMDCGLEPDDPYRRTTEVTYRWDPATERFVPDSDALEELARRSSERF